MAIYGSEPSMRRRHLTMMRSLALLTLCVSFISLCLITCPSHFFVVSIFNQKQHMFLLVFLNLYFVFYLSSCFLSFSFFCGGYFSNCSSNQWLDLTLIEKCDKIKMIIVDVNLTEHVFVVLMDGCA
jgi:hypothetical protein